MGKFKPLEVVIGGKYGKWIVLDLPPVQKHTNYYWTCQCECGKIKEVSAHRLVSGQSKGCSNPLHKKGNKNNVRHGLRNSDIYPVWRNMKARCLNPNSSNYFLYGGRGIKVCDRWIDFINFYEDMGSGYTKGLHIDRIDVNGDYCKENCRWVTPRANAANKRNTVFITYKGQTKRAQDWAKELGLKAPTLVKRFRLGYSPAECLFGKNYEQIKRLLLAYEV